jgi:transcriptional regulator with XRE-family HTH domain
MPSAVRQVSGANLSDDVSELIKPRPIDVHIGNQIQIGRALVGISEARLAQMVGLTCSELQDFERGATRVGAVWLFELAGALGVSVSFFFEDAPAVSAAALH